MNFIKNGIFQIIIAVLLGFFIESYLSIEAVSFFYTISLLLKDFLMLLLPFLIFFCLSSVLSAFKSSAPLLVLGVIGLVILSNMSAVLTAYTVGCFFLPNICNNECIILSNHQSEIDALFRLPLQTGIKNEFGLIFGVLTGLSLPLFNNTWQTKISAFLIQGKNFSTLVLKKCFIPFLPFYVFGFILKLNHDDCLNMLIHSYGKIFIISIIIIILYIFLMYLIASNFSYSKAMHYIKTMLPAGLTGLSTMSSMAALPVTLRATEENLNDEDYAEFIVPSTANIHMVGDGINIALTALSLLLMTKCALPAFSVYLLFVFHYCIVKFSGVGVPGGGVLVILPVVQTYLGLSPELASLLYTIYILQDALLTSANVMANGAFAIITHNIFKKLKLIK